MGVDAQVANAAPPQATATLRKASWPLVETAEATEVPEPTSSCGREGSSSPRTLGGGSPPGAKAGGSAAGEDSVCDATFGDLRALSDQILRNAEGVLEDIPLSQWEQLVGFFDESWPQRGDTPTTASLDKLSLADDDVAWPGLKVAADEVTPLPFDFAAGQLDPESLFDPEMVTESWINVSADPPALPDIAMFEARAHERTRAALLGLSAAPTRVASMRTTLESLLLLHDRELDGLAERRAVDADVQLAAAYVSLEHQQGWEYALQESHASVLKSRGLTDALTDPDATPYNRAIVLRIEELRRSFAAALRGFDVQLAQQAARLASLRAEPGSAADIASIAASLPSALTGVGLDRPGITQRAWEIEASGAFGKEVLPGAALKGMLAAPEQASSAVARKVLTGPLDARLASRAAAMHRMALRAFATAAAEAAAPEKHPETAAALLPASSKPTALQLRGSAPELRCGGRPTPASRSTLKAWMQDHFFPSASHPHGPFPTAAEKEALADQTGLSVNQISDWFVNARARWWKPMVEGMHRGLCDADDEPAAALPAVPEGGSGDDAMDEAEARATAPRKMRRRAGSGIARAPAPLQHDFPAGGRARNGSRGGSECGSDFDGLVADLGILGGL